MAKLPPMSRDASYIKTALAEGRRPDAVKHAIKKLREGLGNPVFLHAVADLLEMKPQKGRGRPKKLHPAHWFEIGQEHEHFIDSGQTSAEAVSALAVTFGQSERNVQRAVSFYREAKEEADNYANDAMAASRAK